MVLDLSKTEASKLGLFSTVVGHVGDGNFHQTIMYNPNKQEEKDAVAKCIHRMLDRAIEMEGTVSVSVTQNLI